MIRIANMCAIIAKFLLAYFMKRIFTQQITINKFSFDPPPPALIPKKYYFIQLNEFEDHAILLNIKELTV